MNLLLADSKSIQSEAFHVWPGRLSGERLARSLARSRLGASWGGVAGGRGCGGGVAGERAWALPFFRFRPSNSFYLLGTQYGSGSRLYYEGTAGFSPCFRLRGFHFWCLFLAHSHMKQNLNIHYLLSVKSLTKRCGVFLGQPPVVLPESAAPYSKYPW